MIKSNKMTAIQGIQFENDANGKPIAIKISLEKYGVQLEPFLRQVGVVDIDDEFDAELKNAISSETFLKNAIENINKFPWKK